MSLILTAIDCLRERLLILAEAYLADEFLDATETEKVTEAMVQPSDSCGLKQCDSGFIAAINQTKDFYRFNFYLCTMFVFRYDNSKNIGCSSHSGRKVSRLWGLRMGFIVAALVRYSN